MATAFEPGSPSIDGPAAPKTPKSPRDNDLPLPPVPVPAPDVPGAELDPASKERLQHVLSSDIGMTTLLNRLKQSISSARDFALFLKERSILEEKHAQGLKRLSRSTHDSIRRPESRQGSFAQNFEELTRSHDRMADPGISFSNTLFAMSEELYELATSSEKGRKHWKQTGISAEKRVQDAESAMDKAKGKYNSLAEHYDRARTGEKQPGKFGGLKKSGAQQEEDLHRKLEAADADYAAKVQAAQSQQHELLSTLRPQTVNALQELIKETDAGLSVQVQKFAAQSERLLLGYGLAITPLKGQSPGASQSKSLRDLASNINNERDFVEYVSGFTNKAGSRANEIKYQKHPALSPKQQQQTPPPPSFNPVSPDPYGNYNPNHGKQVSGVTPYQGDGHQGPGPQSPYSAANQPPGPNYGPPRPQQPTYAPEGSQGPGQMQSAAPQLPQLDSFGGDRFEMPTSEVVSPGGAADSHYRGPSSQFNNPPGQPPSPQPDYMRSPGSQTQAEFKPPGTPDMNSPNIGMHSPGGPPLTVQTGNRPPRGASLGQSGDFTSGSFSGPPGAMENAGRPPQHPGPQQYPGGPQDSGPRPVLMGRGQGPPETSNSEFRPMGSDPGPNGPGSGPQPGTLPQGPSSRMPGSGPLGPSQMPRNGSPRLQQAPQNGARPFQGPTDAAPRAHPAAVGSIGSLPSRAAQAQRSGPPVKPVFGVSLDDLFQRDGSAVPTIVYQCVQAVDLYGLDFEGIYRTSGSAHHIMELRQQFDHNSNSVDFRNASVFHNDIASVTTLLKHFLRDLPDPLLTAAQYPGFIQAARLDDEVVRRDSIHALVNALPDPNYATLRVLSLHLHRVSQHSARNKMTNSNLAIVFAPTLMGQGGMNGHAPSAGADIADAGWQAKVVETILNNTFQIFDDDE